MQVLRLAVPLVSLSCLLLSCGSSKSNGSPATSPRASSPQQDANCHSLMVQGVARTYLLHVPANFPANSGAPVLALGGGGNNAADMETGTQLNNKADQAGFALAYPDEFINPGEGSTNLAFSSMTSTTTSVFCAS
jgi:poly(3-hydroxybutyrate) depolymerase